MVVNHSYFKLYKPHGYLSQFIYNQKQRKNKRLLGDFFDFPPNTMPVGRLDEKSEGLLLLTTDGEFSYHITSTGVEKEYHVLVDGLITEDHIKLLRPGILLNINGEPYTTKPCKVTLLENTSHIIPRHVRDERHGPTSWIRIALTEGKYHQIRKMTAKIGFPTLRLVRFRIGTYSIGDMLPGEVRPLIV
jgi:23S rRNA pseudouridine2457 synthase